MLVVMAPSRTKAQLEASRMNGSRGRGPVSAAGRTQSALNRVGHGIRAKRVLLPNEDPDQYRRQVETWVAALAPANQAEAEVIFDLADARWRLGRLDTVERQRHLRAIEERITGSRERARLDAVDGGIRALSAMIETLTGGRVQAVEDLRTLDPTAKAVFGMLAAVEAAQPLPVPGLGVLEAAWKALLTGTAADLPVGEFEAMVGVGREVVDHLAELRAQTALAVERLRVDVEVEVVVGGDRESARLRRYREGLDRQVREALVTLEQLRRLRSDDQPSGSFNGAVQVVLRAKGVRVPPADAPSAGQSGKPSASA